MTILLVLAALGWVAFLYQEYRMSAALDRVNASVQASVAATSLLIAAYQAAPGAQEAALNAVADQIDASTAAVNAALGTTPVAP